MYEPERILSVYKSLEYEVGFVRVSLFKTVEKIIANVSKFLIFI